MTTTTPIHSRITLELDGAGWCAIASWDDEGEIDATGPDPLTAMTRLAGLLAEEVAVASAAVDSVRPEPAPPPALIGSAANVVPLRRPAR